MHSRSTPKGAPACSMESKSYDWDVRNLAKIGSKMTKRQPNVFYSHSTPYLSPICALTSKSYERDSSELEEKRPKPTPLPHMRLWFKETEIGCKYQVKNGETSLTESSKPNPVFSEVSIKTPNDT